MHRSTAVVKWDKLLLLKELKPIYDTLVSTGSVRAGSYWYQMRGAANKIFEGGEIKHTTSAASEKKNEREKETEKRVTYVKAQVQPYPVESVEIVEWLLWVEWVDILLVVDWGDFISTPTYTGILERLRHYHRSYLIVRMYRMNVHENEICYRARQLNRQKETKTKHGRLIKDWGRVMMVKKKAQMCLKCITKTVSLSLSPSPWPRRSFTKKRSPAHHKAFLPQHSVLRFAHSLYCDFRHNIPCCCKSRLLWGADWWEQNAKWKPRNRFPREPIWRETANSLICFTWSVFRHQSGLECSKLYGLSQT